MAIRLPPPGFTDVGRTTPFGNPVRIGATCPICSHVHTTAGSTIPCYTKYLDARLSTDPSFVTLVLSLSGHRLWCPGCGTTSPTCHARVLEHRISTLTQEPTR